MQAWFLTLSLFSLYSSPNLPSTYYCSLTKTIYASVEDTQCGADSSGELSRIIKSDDSPDTLSERGGGLQDSRLGDSFSFADISMLRTSRDCTPYERSQCKL